MSQLITVDRATLEQLVVELQRMSNACELEGDNHRNGDKWYRLCDDADKALTAGRAALAKAERVEPDTQRLNWLGQNFYSRENLDFITGRPSKTHTMWVFFAPIKVQGDIRRVLDAAKDE